MRSSRFFLFLALIFMSVFSLQAEISFEGGEKNQQDALAAAERFLSFVQQKQATEAWTEASKGFKEAAPLPEFLKALGKYPFLAAGEHEFASIDLTGDYAEIIALFEKDRELFRVFLYMSKQDSVWQVWGIKVEGALLGGMKTLELSETFDETPFHKSVEDFLSLIKSGQKEQAYENYTTKEFKKSATSDSVAAFFQKYSFFIDAVPDWQPIRFQGNDAYCLVFFVYPDGRIYPAEFQLSKEEDVWKLEAIKVFKLHGG